MINIKSTMTRIKIGMCAALLAATVGGIYLNWTQDGPGMSVMAATPKRFTVLSETHDGLGVYHITDNVTGLQYVAMRQVGLVQIPKDK